MKYYIISEERLKQLIKHERELCYTNSYSVFYRPPEKELEVTDDDLKAFTEIKEHEYVPDIDFTINFKDRERFPAEIINVTKFEPNFDSLFEEDE